MTLLHQSLQNGPTTVFKERDQFDLQEFDPITTRIIQTLIYYFLLHGLDEFNIRIIIRILPQRLHTLL
jgi:hypothetical protein